jgi:hypothetical protein
MKAIARAVLVTFALLGAGFTCEQSAPTVVGNVVVPTLITLPPAWTPTWDGKPSPIPGWALVSGNGVELLLPTSYFGGDPVPRADELTNLVDTLPPYAWLADLVRADPAAYALLAVNPAGGAVVTISVQEVPVDRAMESYIETWITNASRQTPGTTVIEKNTVQFREQSTGRLILELVVQDKSLWQLSYLVRREAQVWAFSFAAVKEDFYQIQPVFEQSIQSMKFLPTEEED